MKIKNIILLAGLLLITSVSNAITFRNQPLPSDYASYVVGDLAAENVPLTYTGAVSNRYRIECYVNDYNHNNYIPVPIVTFTSQPNTDGVVFEKSLTLLSTDPYYQSSIDPLSAWSYTYQLNIFSRNVPLNRKNATYPISFNVKCGYDNFYGSQNTVVMSLNKYSAGINNNVTTVGLNGTTFQGIEGRSGWQYYVTYNSNIVSDFGIMYNIWYKVKPTKTTRTYSVTCRDNKKLKLKVYKQGTPSTYLRVRHVNPNTFTEFTTYNAIPANTWQVTNWPYAGNGVKNTYYLDFVTPAGTTPTEFRLHTIAQCVDQTSGVLDHYVPAYTIPTELQ